MNHDPETGEVFDNQPSCIDCGNPLDTRPPRCLACWRASRVCPCGESITSTYPRAKWCEKCKAEAQRVVDERAAARAADIAAIRGVDPACEVVGDPSVVWRAPVRLGGDPTGVLLALERLSGRGLPGSRLVIAARSYDGCGPNGGDAKDYVSVFVTFADARGIKRRTIGVAIRGDELRAFIATLTKYAEELEAKGAA